MRKNIFLWLSVLVFMLPACMEKGKRVDAELKVLAKTLSAKCPMKLTDDTRLDTVYNQPGRILAYRYTLTILQPDKFDAAAFTADRKRYLAQTIKSSPDMTYLRSLEVNFVYEYFNEAHHLLSKIMVTPKDYQ